MAITFWLHDRKRHEVYVSVCMYTGIPAILISFVFARVCIYLCGISTVSSNALPYCIKMSLFVCVCVCGYGCVNGCIFVSLFCAHEVALCVFVYT